MTDTPAVALPSPLPDRINLGCGWDHRPGWLNVDLFDFHKPDLVADITDLPMLPGSHFREIVAQDVLEHVTRAKVAPALQEWSRLAAPEAVIFLRVPSLPDAAALLSRPDRQSPEQAEEIIHLIYGTQAYGGDFHLSGFTFRSLAARLAEVGFALCEARLRDEWLIEASARKTTALTAPEERLHNRAVWLLGQPAPPETIAALAPQIRAATTDAEIDALLARPELKPAVMHPPEPTGPMAREEGEQACARIRTLDLLRVLAQRVRRRTLG
jgi:hypothetical protein